MIDPTDHAKIRAYLEARSIPAPPSTCRLWTQAPSSSGYGAAYWRSERVDAHVLSWVAHFGPVPEGMLVCHRCDERLCVEPSCLFVGSHADNTLDARRKLRLRIKLTPELVRQIRSRRTLGLSLRALADEFKISKTMAGNVVRFDAWSFA